MATLIVENVPPPHPFDAIAVDIERRYKGIVNVVRKRKFTLLTQLSKFREEYDSLLSNRDKTERELKSAEEHIEKLKENDLKTMQQEFVAKIEEKIQKLRTSTANYFIQFVCKSEELENKLSELGELVKLDNKILKKSGMETPIVAVGKKGNGKDEFNEPRGIAFNEETQMIFVCDMSNSCVKILTINGEYISEFGRDELETPWGILLCENSIYVTDSGHCAIFQFHVNTHQLIRRVGKKGTRKGEFNSPRSLAIGPDGDLYLAEDNNNRISVLDRDLHYKRFFQHKLILSPVDVQFTIDAMLVLSLHSPHRVHLLTLQAKYIKSIILIEVGAMPCFFCLDRAKNILVSISNKNLVQIYTEEGELIRSIGKDLFEHPSGLIATRNGKLIAVSNHADHGLQVFQSRH